jgi:5-methylcytosine-specific restriction endonuclease McrA
MNMEPPYVMRESCRWCRREGKHQQIGYLRESGGQDVIRCAGCDRACYNAPKYETGKPQRTLKTRADLKPGQRTRILERDGAVCLLCKRRETELHIAHALSVADIKKHGILDIEPNDDANLFVCCEECNLDMRERSVEARIFLHLIAVRIRVGQQ